MLHVSRRAVWSNRVGRPRDKRCDRFDERFVRGFRKNKKEKKQINIKNRNVAKKERSSAAVDEQFLSNLVQLGKIVLPSWRCKSVFLLSTQTVMLISRSYISLE